MLVSFFHLQTPHIILPPSNSPPVLSLSTIIFLSFSLANYPAETPVIILSDHLEAVGFRECLQSSIKDLIGSPMLFQLFSTAQEWIESHPFSVDPLPIMDQTSKISAKIKSPSQSICKFFVKGSCKFGSKCKNYHPDSESSQQKGKVQGNLSLSSERKSVTYQDDVSKISSVSSKNPLSEGIDNKEKKESMRTASDVISRILWDQDIKTEEFSVGYLDRFVGIIEKPFSSFSWEELSTIGQNVLAVPKHRIQYFKYREEVVWDKRIQLDNVFGSRGGKLIQEVINVSQSKEQTSTVDISNQKDIDETLKDITSETSTPVSLKGRQNDRPTHFVCIHITDEEITSNVQKIQDNVTNHYPQLADCCLPLTALHVTLCMVRLETSSHLDIARTVLEDTKKNFSQYLPRCTNLVFTGVDNFHDRLIYAKVSSNLALDRFSFFLIERFKRAGLKTPGNHAKFTPHMTLVKMSRPIQHELHTTSINQTAYVGFADMWIGKQEIRNIHLCSMTEPKVNGFYKCFHSVSNSLVNLSPLFPSVLSKFIQMFKENTLINETKATANLLASISELPSTSTDTSTFDGAIETVQQLMHINTHISDPLRNRVIILRGIPGSGKSHISKHCSEKSLAICSADSYFTKAESYDFKKSCLPEAHIQCCDDFLQAIVDGKEFIVIDNTNSMLWEYEVYIYVCELLRIRYHILEIPHPNKHVISGYCSRNLHKIDMISIKSFTDHWEPDKRAILIPPKLAYPQTLPPTSELFQFSLLGLCQPGYLPENLAPSTPLVIVYTGIFLVPESQWKLVSLLPPTHTKVLADHITLTFKPSLESTKSIGIGRKVSVMVKGLIDNSMVQVVTIDLPKGLHSQNKHPHITISTEELSSPKLANDLLESQLAVSHVDSVKLEGVVGVMVRKALPAEVKERKLLPLKDYSAAEFYTILSEIDFTDTVLPRVLDDNIENVPPTPIIKGNESMTPSDYGLVSICTGVQKITELYLFDFDGTLFETPDIMAGQQLYEKSTGCKWPFRGWFSRPESLLPPLKIKPGPALADYHRHFHRAGSYTVVLTARIQGTEEAVRAVLTDHQLSPDMLILKPQNTRETNPTFKVNSLSKLLGKFPDTVLVKFWDDRADNLAAVKQFSKMHRNSDIKFEVIDSTRMVPSTTLSSGISNSLIGSHLAACGLLQTPEYIAAAQTGIQFIASQFCSITGFQGDPSSITLVFGSHVLGRKSDVDLCLLAPPNLTQFDCIEKLATLLEKCGITHIHRGYSSRCPRLKIMLQFHDIPSINYDVVFTILSSADIFHACTQDSVLSVVGGPEKLLRAEDRASKTALTGPVFQQKVQETIKDFISFDVFGAVIEMTVQVLTAKRQKGNSYHCTRTFHLVRLLADFINTYKGHYLVVESITCDSLFQEFLTHSAVFPDSKWQKLFGNFVPSEFIPRISQTFKVLSGIIEQNDIPLATRYEDMLTRPLFPPIGYIPIRLLISGGESTVQWKLETVLEARLPTFIRQLLSSGLDVVPDGNIVLSSLCFAVQETKSTTKIVQAVFRQFWNEFSEYQNRKDIKLELKCEGTVSPQQNKDEEDGNDITKQVTEFVSSELSELHFPASLTSYERLLVHETAERLGINHKTEGNGNKRHIFLYK